MRWEGGRRGGGVEDRRGMGGARIAGGGLGTLAIALIGYFLFGIDPQLTTQVVNQYGAPREPGRAGTPADQDGQFVDVVSANINDVWSARMEGYRPPRVVLYEQGTSTGCGFGQSAMGPFYCPPDATIYLDVSFWREMESRLGASGAEFARAYVIAHEFGHHIQRLTGATGRVEQARRSKEQAEANRYSVALELQADCYAGVWAAHAAAASNGQVALDPGDLEEGLKTARAIGDDALQRRSQGRVVPENFTHGSSDQRMKWLKRGYETRDPRECDTFAGL